MFKRTIAALTILAAVLCFAIKVDAAAKSDKWIIYWYVCGTDIETTRIAFGPGTDLMSDDSNAIRLADPNRQPGDATRSIMEVERATLSPNVKIFMQAGGTYIWGHEKFRDLNAKIQTGLGEGSVIGNGNAYYAQWFLRKNELINEKGEPVLDKETGKPLPLYELADNGKIGRYVFDKTHRSWNPLEQIPITGKPNTPTDMGSKAGLVSFLQAAQKFEREKYPDGNVRRVLIFKDHGSGVSACSDEYTKNIISVEAMKEAFNEVQGNWANPEEKPFEVIVFDACLMSTYETAIALEDAANYMVASQETTYGKGNFSYADLLNELSKNPSMSGKELGKIICNTGLEDTKIVDRDFSVNTNAIFTLSVVDLSEQKMTALKTAYENFSATVNVAKQNPDDIIQTFAKFKNAANVAERYPSDNPGASLVDLKNFAGNVRDTFPELKVAGNDLIKAIENSVVYNKRGDVLSRGGGLSSTFPTQLYSALQENIQRQSVDLSSLKDTPIFVDEDKKIARVEIGEEDLKRLDSVRYQIAYLKPNFDSEGNERLAAWFLGGDNAIKENRQAGAFESAFNGKWVTLDGQPLFTQVVSDATRKNKNGKKIGGNDICIAPIWLNDKPYKLFFSRKYPSGKITVIGAVPNDGKITLPNNEIESLKKGDIVIPQYYLMNPSMDEIENSAMPNVENMTPEQQQAYMSKFIVRGNAITIGDKPKIETGVLRDGLYLYVFQFVNPMDQSVLPQGGVVFKLKDGNVVGVKHVEDLETFSDLEDFDAQ